MAKAARDGAAINMGVDHDNLTTSVMPVSEDTRKALVADFQ